MVFCPRLKLTGQSEKGNAKLMMKIALIHGEKRDIFSRLWKIPVGVFVTMVHILDGKKPEPGSRNFLPSKGIAPTS